MVVMSGVTSIEVLRRRLYSPGATQEDHARYRAAVDAGAHMPDQRRAPEGPSSQARVEATAASVPARPSRVHRRFPVAVGFVAATAVAVVVAAQHSGTPSRATVDGHAAIRAAAIHSAGPLPPSPVSVDDATRAAFLHGLERGGSPGIARFLATHRVAADLATTPLHLIERHGSGPQTVALNGPAAELASGEATVFLVTGLAGWAAWSAYDAGEAYEGGEHVQLEAARAGDQEGGELTAGTFAYATGDRPLQLRVEVPDGVGWGVAVAFSD